MSAAKAGHPMRVRVNSQTYNIPSRYLDEMEIAYWVNPLLAVTKRKPTSACQESGETIISAEQGLRDAGA